MPRRIDGAAELFASLVALAPGARAARLERECAGRSALRAEVESLLAAHDAAGGFLDEIDASAALALVRDAAEAPPAPSGPVPERVGPYRVVRELGRGGMGVVYLAERVEGGFEQRVALKLLAPGADSAAIHRRFLAERQILATLAHPNVAALLDGGVLADGRPYFALELVEGEPITAWCDRRRLGVDERLELFLGVCDAVRFAHARLVVHRDLKPSNILVTAEGEPKLLDFGIAKVLGDGAEAEPATGMLGAPAALTPEYASPEQLRGAAVTTASDVYSLGVVLYELLTGRRPHLVERGPYGIVSPATLDAPPTSPSDAVRAACERREPSGATRTLEPGEIAAARATNPARLRRRLAGDLDAIVERALLPEADRRYPSAEALAVDLRRHLRGVAVEARRSTVGYRVAKFTRRHRLGVAAAATATLALAAGLATTAWQAARAAREARRAQAVQGFLVEVFERADPSRSLGETVTARELLDEGARRLAAGGVGDEATRAEIADTLARTYAGLGRLEEARRWARESVAGFRRALGASAPRTALAELTAAEIASDVGEVPASRAAVDALEPRLRLAFGEGSPEHLRVRSAHAKLLVHTGDFEQALAEHRAILGATRARRGSDHPAAIAALIDVGVALTETSRYAEAETVFREALERLGRIGAATSPQWVTVQSDLGDLLDRLGRVEEAEASFRAALETGREVLGSRHPLVAQALIKYGYSLGQQGRRTESEAALREAIAILEPLGAYDAGSAMRYLGFDDLRLERYEEAHELFARAEALIRAELGDDAPMTWACVVSTWHVAARLGRVEEGERRLREAVAALERHHGAESNDVRPPKKYLGEVLRLRGRYAEAEALHRWALELERRLFESEATPTSASTKVQLALDLLESGRRERLAEARELIDAAVAVYRAPSTDPTRLGDALLASGRIAVAENDRRRARRELGEAISVLEPERGAGAPSLRSARQALAALG